MSKKELTPEQYWNDEWGTGFTKATLSEKNGILEMSMDDIYGTMQCFAERYHKINSKELKDELHNYKVANSDIEDWNKKLQARINELIDALKKLHYDRIGEDENYDYLNPLRIEIEQALKQNESND